MKITENPTDGKVIKLGDLRRIVQRADVLEFDDNSTVTVSWARKQQAKLVMIEEPAGPGL